MNLPWNKTVCSHTFTQPHTTPNGDTFIRCMRCAQTLTYPYGGKPKIPFAKPIVEEKWLDWLKIHDVAGEPKHFFQLQPEMPTPLRVYLQKKNAEYKAELRAKHGHHQYKMRPPITKTIITQEVHAFSVGDARVFRDKETS